MTTLDQPAPPRPGRPRLRRSAKRLGLLLAGAVVLAACGSASATDDASPGTPTDEPVGASALSPEDQAILEFYQCLRDHGLDVSDPSPGGRIGLGDVDPDEPAVRAAVGHCRGNLSSSGRVTFGSGEMGSNMADPAALLAFVDCMEDHGIDMDDPDPDGRLSLPEDFDPNSAELQTATRECAPHLGGGGVLIRGGEGGGMATRGNR